MQVSIISGMCVHLILSNRRDEKTIQKPISNVGVSISTLVWYFSRAIHCLKLDLDMQTYDLTRKNFFFFFIFLKSHKPHCVNSLCLVGRYWCVALLSHYGLDLMPRCFYTEDDKVVVIPIPKCRRENYFS